MMEQIFIRQARQRIHIEMSLVWETIAASLLPLVQALVQAILKQKFSQYQLTHGIVVEVILFQTGEI